MTNADDFVRKRLPTLCLHHKSQIWDSRIRVTILGLLIAGMMCSPFACGNDDLQVAESVTESIVPFLKSYCLDCHNSEQAEAKLDLSGFKTASDIAAGHPTWNEVIHRLAAGEMPPADHSPRPSADQSTAFVNQIRDRKSVV